jgi:hypothetical protein
MPRGKQGGNRGGNNSRGRRQNASLPSPGQTTVGRLSRFPLSSQQSAVLRTRLTQVTVATTTGTGALSFFFANNPSSTTRWLNFTEFEEYRVLNMRIHFRPTYHRWAMVTSPTIIQNSEVVAYVSRDTTASPPISKAAAWAFESAHLFQIDSPKTWDARMMGVNDAFWINTASPSSGSFALGVYTDQLTTSFNYGQFYIEYDVEFRGMR